MADSTRPPCGGKDARDDPPLADDPLPSLDAICEEHRRYVRMLLARFGVTPTHWREDIAQEILVEAHRSKDSRLDVRALLFGIARRIVWRWARRWAHLRRADQAAYARQESTVDSAEDERLEADRRAEVEAAVDTAIGELPEIFREVFVRAEVRHQTMPEIVADLGIPLNTGYTRLHLARARFLEALRRYLARHGGEL